MRLLVIESSIRGHRPAYLQRIIREATRREIQVTLATTEQSFQHPVIQELFTNCPAELLQSVECKPPGAIPLTGLSTLNLVLKELLNLRFCAAAFRKARKTVRFDYVLLPYFDPLTNATALFGAPFGDTPWGGIVMRQCFHYQEMGMIGPPPSLASRGKKSLFLRLLAKVRGKASIFSIDPTLSTYVDKLQPSLGSALHYLPDPVDIAPCEEEVDIRELLGIPENSLVILLYGSLTERKGLRHLLEALPLLNDDVHLLLAGKQDPGITEYLSGFIDQNLSLSRRIHEINRYIDDAEESPIFEASDIAWLGYVDHYTMSGVMIQAARCGVPVIATRVGLIGWMTEKYRIGETIDVDDTSQIIDAVDSLGKGQSGIPQGNFGELYTQHTIESFQNILFDTILGSCKQAG